jgi:hypothetical protein
LQEDWGDWLKDSCRYFSQKLFFLAEHWVMPNVIWALLMGSAHIMGLMGHSVVSCFLFLSVFILHLREREGAMFAHNREYTRHRYVGRHLLYARDCTCKALTYIFPIINHTGCL